MSKEKVDFLQSKDLLTKYREEMAKRIIGQTALIDGMLMACIARGHILLEGVPGLAKTLAVKTFSEISSLSFKRIQFTPDLLPADLIGTLMYEQGQHSFSVRKGPVFANLVLADEINRAPAKVQSALLEAMAEQQVTIGDSSYPLPDPFFVLATQNPIEQEGTYTLPEAELDRFLLKLHLSYPSLAQEAQIVRFREEGQKQAPLAQILKASDIEVFRSQAQSVSIADSLVGYLVSLVGATRPTIEQKKDRRMREDYLKYIAFGASPRASIALSMCAKIQALFEGRDYVIPEDIKAVTTPVLRHRLVLSYEAGADGLHADDIIAKILSIVPVP